jgi:hypothetical protein
MFVDRVFKYTYISKFYFILMVFTFAPRISELEGEGLGNINPADPLGRLVRGLAD